MPRVFHFDTEANRAIAEKKVFGQQITNDQYADLAGDIWGDAEIEVSFNTRWPTRERDYPIKIRSQNGIYATTIRLDNQDFNYCECIVFPPHRHQGHARAVLKRVAQTARALGFSRLVASGSKSKKTNGNVVYPKLGFNASIPKEVVPLLPPELASCTTILDILDKEIGVAFWEAKGVQLNHMEFDLAPESRCCIRLGI